MVFVQCETKACEACGALFEGRRLARRKFCSRQCAGKNVNHNSRRLRAAVYQADKVCEHCGATFHVIRSSEKKRRFCSNACRGAWQSALPHAEWRAKLSANTANRPRGEQNYFWAKPSHGKVQTYTRPDGSDVRLRSTWELAVARWLDRMGIAWEYEPRRFRLEDRTYTPDFWLPTLGVFWEIKGWLHARHAETIEQFRRLHPETPRPRGSPLAAPTPPQGS